MINVESCQPRRLNIISLEAPRTSSRRAAARSGIVDAVAAANHKRMWQLIGKSKARLDSLVVRVVVRTIILTGKHLNAVQWRKSGHLQRRQRVGIEPVHA